MLDDYLRTLAAVLFSSPLVLGILSRRRKSKISVVSVRCLPRLPIHPLGPHVPTSDSERTKQEIARLDEEGRLQRVELAKMVEKAEGMSKGVNDSLDQLADHMLEAR